MKKFLMTIMCIMLALVFTACGGNERTETEPQDISLGLSTAENDIEYMQTSDLSVFGLEKAENCTLTLDFTDSESTGEGFIVSGTGSLDLNGKKYDFILEDQELICIEVSEENTVYSGILDSSISMENGEEQMESVSDFDESFLDAEQDAISTQNTDAEAMPDADANTDGIGNE